MTHPPVVNLADLLRERLAMKVPGAATLEETIASIKGAAAVAADDSAARDGAPPDAGSHGSIEEAGAPLGGSSPSLLQLPDAAFCDAWRALSIDARNDLPADVRSRALARFNRLTPYVGESVKRAERALRARAIEEPAAINFDRGEPGVHDRQRARDTRTQDDRRGAAARGIPRIWLDDATLPEQSVGHVKGLIGTGELVVVYGPPSSGKTFFTIDLVGHVAAALSWRGRRTSGAPVIYVAAEAGRSITKRFVPWRDRHIGEAREARVPLAIVTRAVNLLQVGDVGELLAELETVSAELGEAPGVVVFDTLSRSTPGGDENSSETMSGIVGVADMIRDRFGAATIIVHHGGKDPTKGARGHTALTAAADAVISVVDRVATIEKVRDGIAGEQFPFALEVVELGQDAEGAPITSCVVAPSGTVPDVVRPQPALSGVAQTALRALHEALDEHGESLPASSIVPRPVRAVKLDHWRKRFALRYGEDGERDSEAVKKAFQRAREQLLKLNAVEIATPYAWLSRR